MLVGCKHILDPFAGTGKLKNIFPDAILLEIEPEWAVISKAIVGDALYLPFRDQIFDAVVTSPTYGNRMADNFVDHQREKKYVRNTYRHTLGRELTKNNSGAMNWGKSYRELHKSAWNEVYRVLNRDGLFLLNISDHIRKGKIIEVSKWHYDYIISVGFNFINEIKVGTKRQRMGANRNLRVSYESVFLFKK